MGDVLQAPAEAGLVEEAGGVLVAVGPQLETFETVREHRILCRDRKRRQQAQAQQQQATPTLMKHPEAHASRDNRTTRKNRSRHGSPGMNGPNAAIDGINCQIL